MNWVAIGIGVVVAFVIILSIAGMVAGKGFDRAVRTEEDDRQY